MTARLHTSEFLRTGFCLLLLTLSSVLSAQESYKLDPTYPVHNLMPSLQIFPEDERALKWQEVIDLPDENFKKRTDFGRFLDAHTAYWGRIHLESEADLQGWVLHFEDHWSNNIAWIRGVGKAEVFLTHNGELLSRQLTGADVKRSDKPIKNHWISGRVPLELQAGQEYTLLIRVEGNSFGFFPYFNLRLRHPDYQGYFLASPGIDTFLWFSLGFTFLALVYHLLLWLYTREKIFGWFSVWLALCAISQAMTVGLDTEYLIGNFPQFRVALWLLIPNSMLFTFWFFGRAFINSREKFPLLDKLLVSLCALMILELLVTLLYVLLGDPVIEQTQVGYHYYFITLFAILGLGLAIAIALQKDLFARYFGIGAIIATTFVTVGGLWSIGLIRPVVDPYTAGMLFQIVAYSFGIAYRQQQLKLRAAREHLAYERSQAEMQRIRDLDEVKSRFFANISHEFRTPLSLIKGPLEDLNSNGKKIMIDHGQLSLIQRNADRLETLVDQLLELSKLESGEERLNLEQGDLLPFLKATVLSFESMAERKNISMQTSFPPQGIEAWFDRDKLEKILTNLLSNAFKYTPAGGSVRIGLDIEDEQLCMEISDTGKGMKAEAVKHIFERFYRVEGTEAKGSGIGLALVKELVDLHQGQVHVSSTQGEGTSFRVRIPISRKALGVTHEQSTKEVVKLSRGKIQADIAMASTDAPAQPIAAHGDRSLVLVVEDNPDLRGYIAGILQGDFEVLLADDGIQGERMGIEHVPDVIVSDVMMPGKDGFALCHGLKSNPKTSHIPIILLTAKAGQQNKLEGLGQGADAYLTKPFNTSELKLRVNNLIASRKRIWEQFRQQGHLLFEDIELTSLDDKFLQQVMDCIRKNLDNDELSVEDIAREVGFSRSQLHRKLKALTNKSASQLLSETRLNEARRLLEQQVGSVSEIAYSVGFSNLSYFTKSFKEKFGMLPSAVARAESKAGRSEGG